MARTFTLSPRPSGHKPSERKPKSQSRDLSRREIFSVFTRKATKPNYVTPVRSEQPDVSRPGRLPSTSPNTRQQGGPHDQQ